MFDRAKHAKDRRKRLLKAGKCPDHPDRDVVPGLKHCQECCDYAKKNSKKLIKAGKCIRHWDCDVVPGLKCCQKCRDYVKKNSKKYRVRLLKAGKCPMHPDRDVVPGLKCCQKCRDNAKKNGKKHRARRRKAGRCITHPGRDVALGRTKCQDCLDKLRGPEHAIYDGVRRAKKNFAPFESVDRLVVFERDAWKCRHCGKSVNGDARGDHVVPVSLGGPHTYWNHQTLCDKCNSAKRDDVRKEPRLAHLVHLPMKKLIEAFAKEQGATLPRGWWAERQKFLQDSTA